MSASNYYTIAVVVRVHNGNDEVLESVDIRMPNNQFSLLAWAMEAAMELVTHYRDNT